MNSGPAAPKTLRHRIMTPLRDLIIDSRATGIFLLGCTVISIVITNSSSGWYSRLWNGKLPGMMPMHLPTSPLAWINNFLMAFFFVLAATEIKRELLAGELSTFKKAILPFGAAFGGMLVPAIIFTVFNFHTVYSHGWGIPTATDIAFSLAAASLLGKRFPVGLKILLMALAIIDDLGAIIVIAVFYGGQIHWIFLLASVVLFVALLGCNRLKVKFGWLHLVLGAGLWYFMLQSGVEASITGVLFAFALPVDALALIEKAIHKYVNFLILPLFALSNTAMLIPSNLIQSLNTTVAMGVIFGLVIGKPLGIYLISRLMVGLNIAHLPANVRWRQVLGMGMLAGIGFTMSIFTTMLAFKETRFRDTAKISILVSVLASVIVSYLYFAIISRAPAMAPVRSLAEPSPEAHLELS